MDSVELRVAERPALVSNLLYRPLVGLLPVRSPNDFASVNELARLGPILVVSYNPGLFDKNLEAQFRPNPAFVHMTTTHIVTMGSGDFEQERSYFRHLEMLFVKCLACSILEEKHY